MNPLFSRSRVKTIIFTNFPIHINFRFHCNVLLVRMAFVSLMKSAPTTDQTSLGESISSECVLISHASPDFRLFSFTFPNAFPPNRSRGENKHRRRQTNAESRTQKSINIFEANREKVEFILFVWANDIAKSLLWILKPLCFLYIFTEYHFKSVYLFLLEFYCLRWDFHFNFSWANFFLSYFGDFFSHSLLQNFFRNCFHILISNAFLRRMIAVWSCRVFQVLLFSNLSS